MGYRNYIGSIPNEKYEEGKDLTQEESEKLYGEDFFSARDLEEFKKLHCFGKYRELGIEKHLEKFYTNNENIYEDCDFHLISKEGYLEIIEWHRAKILAYYKSLLIRDTQATTIHIGLIIGEWEKGNPPYSLDEDEDKDEIVSSWRYEYSIFELVRIFKTFDWENSKMVWYGF